MGECYLDYNITYNGRTLSSDLLLNIMLVFNTILDILDILEA